MNKKTGNTLMNKISSLTRYRMRATPGNICFLGITSIALSWVFGIFGIFLSRYALKLYKRANTGSEEISEHLKKAGIYAWSGMILSSIILFATVLVFFLSIIS
ncbi:MAG TPA: hypothetical protein VHO72_06215 [Bacteroidales bacterium]|nr:hypothetical protein [Bacteroidales bacterium]